jgi:hypothetical protein
MGTRIYDETSRYAYGNLGAASQQPAILGAGECMAISQVGTAVSIVGGTKAAFTAADKGKSIVHADGSVSWIVAVPGDGTATILDSNTRTSLAATMDSRSRNCSVQVSDRYLRTRATDFQLLTRFHEPMPACNVGCVAAGFVFGLQTNGDAVYYSQIPADNEHVACHHRPDYQVIHYTDATQDMEPSEAAMTVWCNNRTETFPLTNFVERRVSAAGETVLIVPTHQTADMTVGALCGNIARVGKAGAAVLTSNRKLAVWNGVSYEAVLSENRFDRLLEEIRGHAVLHYDDWNGINLWGQRD